MTPAMDKLPPKKAEALRRLAAARGRVVHHLEDRVLLIYRRKGHVVVATVRIVGVHHDCRAAQPLTEPRIFAYTVEGPAGGQLTVLPEDIRPGNILEHIKLSIDRDDELARLESSEGRARVEQSERPGCLAAPTYTGSASHQPTGPNSPL